jgi:carbamoyl-phosphate synthase small subunit
MRGVLCLEDGFYLEGELAGAGACLSPAKKPVAGEVVFTTSMAGYEEILTDPSYAGHILVFAFPMLGNYGVPLSQDVSPRVYTRGVIARDIWGGLVGKDCLPLSRVLADSGCPSLTGVDTRALVLHLRECGNMKGVIAPVPDTGVTSQLVRRLRREALDSSLRGLSEEVAVKRLTWLGETRANEPHGPSALGAIVDLGVKASLRESLLELGFRLAVLPPNTSCRDILELNASFVLFSNGPGTPEDNPVAIQTVRGLLGKVPVYGVGLGHQVMARAAGAGIIRLKHGHYGPNHPVKEKATGRVLTTSQNHTFAVDPANLPENVTVTHISVNDGSIEGLKYLDPQTGEDILASSIQFQPEGDPLGQAGGLWAFVREATARVTGRGRPEGDTYHA